MDRDHAVTALRLARWLGPWTRDDASPRDVDREERWFEHEPSDEQSPRSLRAWIYRPTRRRPAGSVLLLHGLHHLGPSDPRMDRFARVLADAGRVVFAPFLQSFERLILAPSVLTQAEQALRALWTLPDRPAGRPGLFSISFGVLPALHLASTPEFSKGLNAAVLFGGYASLPDVLRFCVRGEPGTPHDPLNRPVVFMNLLSHLDDRPTDPGPLMSAWRAYVEQTWGRPELKESPQADAIARTLMEPLEEPARALFARTTGIAPGGEALLESALARAGTELRWLDPSARAREARIPTYVLHGADDDVIPHRHAAMLGAMLPAEMRRGVHVTGLYGHTGSSGAGAGSITHEVRTLLAALRAIARAGHDTCPP
jgi:hypothetical protein